VTGPISVPGEVLAAHAANVDRVAQRVELSRHAAEATQLDRGAYGQLCQFMAEFFEPSMRVTVDGLTSSVVELHGLSASLRSVSAGFASAEVRAADGVRVPRVRLPL
jgi:hypothetical protein